MNSPAYAIDNDGLTGKSAKSYSNISINILSFYLGAGF